MKYESVASNHLIHFAALGSKVQRPHPGCHEADLFRDYYGGPGAEESYLFDYLCNATLLRQDKLVVQSITKSFAVWTDLAS